MKRFSFILLLFLAFSQPLFAGFGTQIIEGPVAVVAGCTENCAGYLVCQNLEGAGYDNSETWNESIGTGGTIDEDDTTATVLRGSQQVKIYAGDAGQSSKTYKTITAAGEVWTHFLFKTTDATPSAQSMFFYLGTSSGGNNVSLNLRTDGNVRIVCGADKYLTSTSGGLSDNTLYHFWVHYAKGTGANAVYEVYWGTSTTRPASPNLSGSDGTITTDTERVYLYSDSQQTNFFDQVLTDDADFSTVCE